MTPWKQGPADARPNGRRTGRTQVRVQAKYIRARRLDARGFSAGNRWWMMQSYETHRGLPKVAPLVRVLSGTHNLLIMCRGKRDEEREPLC
jgi:hypothetical protein